MVGVKRSRTFRKLLDGGPKLSGRKVLNLFGLNDRMSTVRPSAREIDAVLGLGWRFVSTKSDLIETENFTRNVEHELLKSDPVDVQP